METLQRGEVILSIARSKPVGRALDRDRGGSDPLRREVILLNMNRSHVSRRRFGHISAEGLREVELALRGAGQREERHPDAPSPTFDPCLECFLIQGVERATPPCFTSIAYKGSN